MDHLSMFDGAKKLLDPRFNYVSLIHPMLAWLAVDEGWLLFRPRSGR